VLNNGLPTVMLRQKGSDGINGVSRERGKTLTPLQDSLQTKNADSVVQFRVHVDSWIKKTKEAFIQDWS